jgi:hypothetical protein
VGVSVLKSIFPPSEPGMIITNADGSKTILPGGGPSSGALMGQGMMIFGGASAVSQATTTGQRSLALGRYVGEEFLETGADTALGVPLSAVPRPTSLVPSGSSVQRLDNVGNGPRNSDWVDSSVFQEVPFELPSQSIIIGAGPRPIISQHIAGLGFDAAPERTVSAFTQGYLSGSGGRWGGTETRYLNNALSDILGDRGYKTISGGGKRPEEWIPGPGGGPQGGTWVDLTATNGTTTIRIQTIRTLPDGTPTPAEAAAAARIRARFPNDELLLIPKD